MAVLPDLSIRQLEYLVAVVEQPTWAAAAQDVGVSPSALSQGLAELERRIGLPLFDRVGRRRHVRPAAQPVVEHARRVVALTADLARWADRTRSGAIGELRVGMIDAAAIHHFPAVLASFRRDHPDLLLRLRVAPSRELLDALAGGAIDVAVCVAPQGAVAGIDTRELMTEPLAIYRPDGRRAGPPSAWGPWVLFPEGSHTRAVVEQELRRLGAPIEIVAESNQPDVLREMVALDLGWTVLPVSQAEKGERPLARARVLTDRAIVVATRTGAAPDPVAVALVEQLSAA